MSIGKPEGIPQSIRLVSDKDVYCEVAYNDNQTSFDVTWRVRNDASVEWPAQLQLIPVVASPTIRTFFESKICSLRAESESGLRVRIELPEKLEHSYLVLLLKMRTNKR